MLNLKDPSKWKSTLGGIFSAGSTTISWYNKKQRSVVLNPAEDGYMGISQNMWGDLEEKDTWGLFGWEMDPTVIYYDN